MKSEKAKEYLNGSAMHPNSPLAQGQPYVWRGASVVKSVELAEQEAENRAVEAFRYACPHRNRGEVLCKIGNNCDGSPCAFIGRFAIRLNELRK